MTLLCFTSLTLVSWKPSCLKWSRQKVNAVTAIRTQAHLTAEPTLTHLIFVNGVDSACLAHKLNTQSLNAERDKTHRDWLHLFKGKI